MEMKDRMRQEMTRLGVSQASLGKLVGISQVAVQKILSGETRNPRSIVEIASALGVGVKWLKSGTEPKYPTGAPSEPPVNHNKPVVVSSGKPVEFYIDQALLEKAIEQLDADLNGWGDLTPRRRARLIMTYYEELYEAGEGEDQRAGDTIG